MSKQKIKKREWNYMIRVSTDTDFKERVIRETIERNLINIIKFINSNSFKMLKAKAKWWEIKL